MELFKKKIPYIEKKGLMGNGVDYHVYKMSNSEKIIGYLLGFAAGFIGIEIFFSLWFVSLVVAVPMGFIAIWFYKRYLSNKRRTSLLLQFKDMLESLNTSIGAGKNVINSFTDALEDMKNQHGDKAYIVKELEIIVSGYYNSITIEELLLDFAQRSSLDDIDSFANVFAVSNRQGGNLKSIIFDTKTIISEKIEIEMEIETMVTEKKGELNIMMLMPFVMVLALRGFGKSSAFTALTVPNVLSKVFVLILSALAYLLGRKIVNIKV